MKGFFQVINGEYREYNQCYHFLRDLQLKAINPIHKNQTIGGTIRQYSKNTISQLINIAFHRGNWVFWDCHTRRMSWRYLMRSKKDRSEHKSSWIKMWRCDSSWNLTWITSSSLNCWTIIILVKISEVYRNQFTYRLPASLRHRLHPRHSSSSCVRYNDKLWVLTELFDHIGELAYVGIIQRCINFIKDTERSTFDQVDRKQQRCCCKGFLSHSTGRYCSKVFPLGGYNINSCFCQVFRINQHHIAVSSFVKVLLNTFLKILLVLLNVSRNCWLAVASTSRIIFAWGYP